MLWNLLFILLNPTVQCLCMHLLSVHFCCINLSNFSRVVLFSCVAISVVCFETIVWQLCIRDLANNLLCGCFECYSNYIIKDVGEVVSVSCIVISCTMQIPLSLRIGQ